MVEKGPYLFAEIVHADKNLQREEEIRNQRIAEETEKLRREIEERRQERQRENRARFVKNVVYTISGLLGVLCIYALMILCALVK